MNYAQRHLRELWVVDASVAVKWFFTDEENRDRATVVLSALRDNPSGFAVPSWFHQELAAVLIRKSGHDEKFVSTALGIVYQLGMITIPAGEELTRSAVSIACDHHIGYYDALYVALAKSLKGRWLTADNKSCLRLL